MADISLTACGVRIGRWSKRRLTGDGHRGAVRQIGHPRDGGGVSMDRTARLWGLVQELVQRYLQPDGCGFCGGLPHTTGCIVGRLAALLREAEDENALNGSAADRPQEDAAERFRQELSARLGCSSPDGYAELGVIDELLKDAARLSALEADYQVLRDTVLGNVKPESRGRWSKATVQTLAECHCEDSAMLDEHNGGPYPTPTAVRRLAVLEQRIRALADEWEVS